MPRNEIKSKVWHLIAELFGVGIDAIADTKRLRDDLHADSLALVELRIALETEFGVDIPDTVMDGVVIVDDVVSVTKAAHDLAVAELQSLNRRIAAAGAVS